MVAFENDAVPGGKAPERRLVRSGRQRQEDKGQNRQAERLGFGVDGKTGEWRPRQPAAESVH